MANENKFAQNIEKFISGLENKLTDTVVCASNETIKQNAKRDKKCKGLKRTASSKCCKYCMSHEGTYTSEEVDAGKLGGRHEACKCKISAIFGFAQKITAKSEARNLLNNAKKYETGTTALLQGLENDSCKLVGLDYRLKSQESLEGKLLSDASEKGCSAKENRVTLIRV